MTTPMRDPILSDTFHALDLFVAQRLPNSSFVAMTPPPRWLTRFLSSAADGAPVTIVQAFPFLAGFLSEAEAFWRDGTARATTTGPFAVDDPDGELLLRAWALNVGVNTLLVLARLKGEADARPMLQKARDNALAHERLLRQIKIAKAAVEDVLRLTRVTLSSSPSPQHSAFANDIAVAARRAELALSGEPSKQELSE